MTRSSSLTKELLMLPFVTVLVSASVGAEAILQFANKPPVVWQKGNLNNINSAYVEGSCVPYRYEITGIPEGSDVQFEIHYAFTKGGKHAFDFLTSYWLTEGELVAGNGGLFANGPITTIPVAQIMTNALAIPDDVTIITDNLLATNSGTQYLTLCGLYTNASVLVVPSFGDSDNILGDSDKYLSILIQGITNGQIAIAWGGHLAIGGTGNWPQGNGAGSISGSPFHQNGDGIIVASGKTLSTAKVSISAGTVTPSCDLELTKSASAVRPYVGDLVNFTVTCTNKGPSDATSVTVRDLIPAGLQYVSNSVGAAYAPLTGIWTIGSLSANASTQFVVTARVLTPTN